MTHRSPPGDLRRPIEIPGVNASETRRYAGGALSSWSREAITRAALESGLDGLVTRERVAQRVGSGNGSLTDAPDVDLLIRTGGEQRLSDFLLWECAYAELVFSRRMWPEFGTADFDAAIEDFHGRDRRFGGLSRAI